MAQAISQDDYLNDTSQFDLARKKAAEQSTVDLQNRKDALARRFASLGNLDSGAQIKQEQLAQNDAASGLNNANEAINAQQNAELGRRKEVVQGQQFAAGESQKGRDFSAQQAAMQRAYGTSERESGQQFTAGQQQKGQDFTAAQNEVQRKFATGERLSTQDFQSLQAQLGRDFTTEERKSLEDYQSGERQAGQQFQSEEADKQRAVQKEQFEKTYGLSLEQFAAAKKQFEDTFGEEVKVDQANIDLAQQVSGKKGVLEQIGSEVSKNKGAAGGAGVGFLVGGPLGALAGGAIGAIGDKNKWW